MSVAASTQDLVRALAETCAKPTALRDRTGAFPHDDLADLREAGLPGLPAPWQPGRGGSGVGRTATGSALRGA